MNHAPSNGPSINSFSVFGDDLVFGDDFAADWVEDLHDSDPIAFFEHCLDLSDQRDVSQVAGVGVVCTSETIRTIIHRFDSRAKIRPVPGPISDWPISDWPISDWPISNWIEDHADLAASANSLAVVAALSLERVLEPTSALFIRWQDAGDAAFARWKRTIDQLIDDLYATATC